ncbi:hypothetical protein C807_03896 [Lachnospiraceae bacterium 28-4]|nr:hypothetical protein C807_03896 [Lachnospiraceae bacterium 28-4]
MLADCNYDEKVFTEQAEYIDSANLENWHIEHPNEKLIMKKLCQGGAKLLTGPRGCGKTTLLLKAYNEMRHRKDVFSVYVNFKTSLKIEPLYRKNTNGSYWFNQWLFLKIYKGIFKSLRDYEIADSIDLVFNEKDIDSYINKIELGIVDEISTVNELLSISILEDEIKKILSVRGMSSCVLLLDDAAHAFSKEQQYDFFEFFRNIKSREISPKAAIYPGVTNFSASFHVGHDAEEINVWIKVTDDDYIEFMTKLLQKRFPAEIFLQLTKDKDLLNLICYSSFGIPRALLNIVHNLWKGKKSVEMDCSRNGILKSIRQVNGLFMNIYKSLEEQLPIYKEFVKKGDGIYETLLESLKQYNKEKDFFNQAVEVGIKKPIPVELDKVFNFLQYAGLLMYARELSRGENGRYAIYIINYGFLIEKNVFGGRTNIKNVELATALKTRNMHEYKRFTIESLLGEGDIRDMFPFSLPPCPKCHTPRISADTKFCSECGEKLVTPSLFEELVKNDISKLPLTSHRVETIKQNSTIRTIRDILMDKDHKELRGVPQVGAYWTNRIFSYAEEYIG